MATLFVNMAFDAMLHPPDWLKTEWYSSSVSGSAAGFWGLHPHGAPTTAAAPSPNHQAAGIWNRHTRRALFYLVSNTSTFATALAMVIVLLLGRKSGTTDILSGMKILIGLTATSIALTFALGTSDSWSVTGYVCLCFSIGGYAFLPFFFIKYKRCVLRCLRSSRGRTAEGAAP